MTTPYFTTSGMSPSKEAELLGWSQSEVVEWTQAVDEFLELRAETLTIHRSASEYRQCIASALNAASEMADGGLGAHQQWKYLAATSGVSTSPIPFLLPSSVQTSPHLLHISFLTLTPSRVHYHRGRGHGHFRDGGCAIRLTDPRLPNHHNQDAEHPLQGRTTGA